MIGKLNVVCWHLDMFGWILMIISLYHILTIDFTTIYDRLFMFPCFDNCLFHIRAFSRNMLIFLRHLSKTTSNSLIKSKWSGSMIGKDQTIHLYLTSGVNRTPYKNFFKSWVLESLWYLSPLLFCDIISTIGDLVNFVYV